VLANNTSQSLSLSLDERRARDDPEGFLRATEFLTRHGGLDPQLEALPDPEEIRTRAASRTGPVYARPELAILLGYTKMLAKRSLLDSHEPDLDLFGHLLEEYFPVALRSRFREEIARHPLRREITATALVTRVVDRSGVALLPALAESLGIGRTEALVAYQLAGWVLDAEATRRSLYAEPLPEETRLRALIRLEEAVRSGARTLVGLERHPPRNDVALEGWRRGQQDLRKHFAAENGSVRVGVREVAQGFSDQGLPSALAEELAWLPAVVCGLPVVPLIEELGRPPEDVVRAWVRIGEAVRVSDLLDRLDAEGRRGGWDRLAAEGLILDLLRVQRQLTAAALREGTGHAERFLEDRREALDRISSVVERIEGEPTLAPAAFVVQQLRRLC
jgi:glutamate dehydrogenase